MTFKNRIGPFMMARFPATAKGNWTFRGVEEPPWVIADKGLTCRYPPQALAAVLKQLYCAGTKEISLNRAAEYMATYRGSAGTNPLGLPFMSAGPNEADSQGASKARWQYAISKAGFSDGDPVAILKAAYPDLTFKGDTVASRANLVKLRIVSASVAVLEHGPLPELTWVNEIPLDRIEAFLKISTAAWEETWRSMAVASAYRDARARYEMLKQQDSVGQR